MAPRKLLPYPNSTPVPMVIERRFSFENFVVKEQFCAKVEKNATEADILFEQSSCSSDQSDIPTYKTPFMDHKKGEGILISPSSILRVRVERADIWWTDVKFEARCQTNLTFVSWASKMMTTQIIQRKSLQQGLERLWICRRVLLSIDALKTRSFEFLDGVLSYILLLLHGVSSVRLFWTWLCWPVFPCLERQELLTYLMILKTLLWTGNARNN